MTGGSDDPIWVQRFRAWWSGFRDTIFARYAELSFSQKCYVHAGVVLFFYSIARLFVSAELVAGFLGIALIFWIGGILADLLNVYRKVYEHLFGKAFVLLMFTLGANFSLSYAAQVVNFIVGGDPSRFPHTIAFVSVLLIPILAVVGFSIVYVFTLPVLIFLLLFRSIGDEKTLAFFLPGYTSNPKRPFARITLGVQVISFACYGAFLYDWGQTGVKDYDKRVTTAASWYLLNMEMYPKSECLVREGGRVAFLDDGKILVGWKDDQGTHFETEVCAPSKG